MLSGHPRSCAVAWVRRAARILGPGVENVAVHFLGNYRRATLATPEGIEKSLEIYSAEEGSGVDIDKVAVCATIRLEP